MLILLPPSESKTPSRRGRPMDWDSLSFPALTWARQQVADALIELGDSPAAGRALGVPEGKTEELTRNLQLETAPSVRAADLYSGVLFDALDLAGMESADRRRAQQRVLVFSGLYGVLRLNDRVAPYRLSMGAALPGLGRLASFWSEQLAGVLSSGGWFVDCRSAAYASAWRPPAERWVQVSVRGASHNAKHNRGRLAGLLCRTANAPRSLDQIVAVAREQWGHGVEVSGEGPYRLEVPGA
ncbi:YaaA family protein [Enemella dayhoffiae]|uniref:YaaA family protein n=1 Tax=Enemella dayhoffiae TaxID=2016507 RepID=UPI0015959080|nr:peroxide stress protein YaaA [Enemella dayhoffiae]